MDAYRMVGSVKRKGKWKEMGKEELTEGPMQIPLTDCFKCACCFIDLRILMTWRVPDGESRHQSQRRLKLEA